MVASLNINGIKFILLTLYLEKEIIAGDCQDEALAARNASEHGEVDWQAACLPVGRDPRKIII